MKKKKQGSYTFLSDLSTRANSYSIYLSIRSIFYLVIFLKGFGASPILELVYSDSANNVGAHWCLLPITLIDNYTLFELFT